MVDVFERKILRRIYSRIKDRDQWRCRFNKELYDLFEDPRLSAITGIARSRWLVMLHEWMRTVCLGD
jgi:hypothetical protein